MTSAAGENADRRGEAGAADGPGAALRGSFRRVVPFQWGFQAAQRYEGSAADPRHYMRARQIRWDTSQL